jgi:hypothetical protein
LVEFALAAETASCLATEDSTPVPSQPRPLDAPSAKYFNV